MAASITTTANTIEGQLLEIAREMQEQELAIAAADRPNQVGLNFDVDGLVVTISIQLPILISGTGGSIAFAAAPYLP